MDLTVKQSPASQYRERVLIVSPFEQGSRGLRPVGGLRVDVKISSTVRTDNNRVPSLLHNRRIMVSSLDTRLAVPRCKL